jgi:hypothetical protein
MAVRTDITVDFTLSPRIITVAAPSTEVTVQDLVDTLRNIESDIDNGMQYDHLVNAAGKQELGGGVLVGITATLQNALVSFEARSGPTWERCFITGGNLVAVDDVGAFFTVPFQETAYVSIVYQGSSSPTLQEIEAIRHSSFEGRVHIDTVNGASGTDYPLGTLQYPINNLADAITVATNNGLQELRILDDFTSVTGDILSGYTVTGRGREYVTLTLGPGTTTSDTAFRDMTVQGTQSGETHYYDCEILDLNDVHCLFENCRLAGTLLMHGFAGDTTYLNNCHGGVHGTGTPIIDHNDGPVNMIFIRWAGDIKFTNITSASADIVLDIISGKVELDATCTAGNFTIRGNSKFTDNSTGTTVDRSGLVDLDDATIADRMLVGKTVANETAGTIEIYDENDNLIRTLTVTESPANVFTKVPS